MVAVLVRGVEETVWWWGVVEEVLRMEYGVLGTGGRMALSSNTCIHSLASNVPIHSRNSQILSIECACCTHSLTG